MPALITHRLFGEESINRLPAGLVASGEERAAFLLANQGPDPFFFRFRTPSFRTCMELAQVMHRSRTSRQFAALREGTSRLMDEDARLGRAFSLGLLSHYVLDRNAHPFVYEQQWGVMEADESLAGQGSAVHAVIESDLDVLMLQLKRDHATVRDYPPADELATSDHVNKVAGALMSHVAMKVYGLDVAASEYGGAVADMRLAYRAIEPSGSFASRVHPMFAGLVHPVTAEPPRGESGSQGVAEPLHRCRLDGELPRGVRASARRLPGHGRPLHRGRRYGRGDGPCELLRPTARRGRGVRSRGVAPVRRPRPGP